MVPIVKFIYTWQMNERAKSTCEIRLIYENCNTWSKKCISTVLPVVVCKKYGEFRGFCVCIDLHISGLVLVILNILDYSNDNRYECNLILFNSDAKLRK
jgi:hypothetical protein